MRGYSVRATSHSLTEVPFVNGPMDFMLISCTGRQREHDVLFMWHISFSLFLFTRYEFIASYQLTGRKGNTFSTVASRS